MSFSKKYTLEAVEEFSRMIKAKVYTKVADLVGEVYVTPEPVSFKDKLVGEHSPLEVGQPWGKLWDCGYMHFKGRVPSEIIGKKIVLMIDVNGEGCLLDDEGNPIRGITSNSSTFERELGRPVKRVLQFCENCSGDEAVDIWIEVGCNDLFGNLNGNGVLEQADIATCNDVARDYFYDFSFLLCLAKSLEDGEAKRQQIIEILLKSAKCCNLDDDDSIAGARLVLKPLLEQGAADDTLNLWAIGHAHMDLAWLWPIRETKRKIARTFSTVLELMGRYDDYRFGASQPQQFQWLKEGYPKLYDRVKQSVSDGKLECQGAMWVEPDTNISGGEALVRQVLYGKKFFKEEFGKDIDTLWLPDVFGYSGALPQILKKSEVPYFMTIKLSWSKHNEFPHHTFLWEGIDGSQVLSHMPPEGTYNSGATPLSLLTAAKKFKDKDVCSDALLLFGIGDGGGGPSTEHLEFLAREKDMSHLPATKQVFAKDFFAHINENRADYKKWVGELYLECHQGTYTTQSNTKKYNRLLETMLRDCEFVSVMACKYGDYTYPKQQLETIWKEVLLYQFHDILPGSSIKRVYDEAIERYKVLEQEVQALTDAAAKVIAEGALIDESQHLIINTQGAKRPYSDLLSVAPYSFKVVKNDECAPLSKAEARTIHCIENDLVTVTLDDMGNISSIFDKETSREVINTQIDTENLVIYEDFGDCWDMHFTYAEKAPLSKTLKSSRVLENKTGVEFVYTIGSSTITQQISLSEYSKLINFTLDVDWNETNRMLRAKYPVAIHTSQANCNIQFGFISRPTHQNTSWDYARFEVCAHKWVDMSEKGYGVALINNSKYGFKVWDNVLDINLLRSPMYPGKDADKGKHTINYQLLIHDGDLNKVNAQAYLFNSTPISVAQTGGGDVKEKSFISVSNPNIIVETVKQAEYSEDIVIRVYEAEGRHTIATIMVDGMTTASLSNMLEVQKSSLTVSNSSVELVFKPFEIHTLVIKA